MYQPVRLNSGKQQTSQAVSIPASVAGWNQRDSIANMDPTFAWILDNWFPTTGDVMTRFGWTSHATGIVDAGSNPTQVNTLAIYRPAAGAEQLFAFADAYAYNATGVGAVGAPVVSGNTGSQWQWTNYTTIGGHYMLAVNGRDEMLLYDGATWQRVNGTSSPFAITGVDTSTFININVHKSRLWFIKEGSLDAYYLDFNSIAGPASRYPMGGVFQKGGSLVAMGTWTLDGGTGLDDYAVFITDQGEVAVYQGTDPSTIDTWALLGVYNIGLPIGVRCCIKYGSDLLINTSDGVVPASQAFASGRTTEKIALSDNIQGAVAQSYALYGQNFGWEITQFPKGNMLICNIPVAPNQQIQYVMNSITGAWCSFSGWGVNTFQIYNENLYGGTLGAVNRYWSGPSDGGTTIQEEYMPAWSYYGTRTQNKQWKMIRPILTYDVPPASIAIGFDVNFVEKVPGSVINLPAGTGALWDVAKWDQAVWGGGTAVNTNWLQTTGELGFAGAPHILVQNQTAQVRIASFDIVYANAGVL